MDWKVRILFSDGSIVLNLPPAFIKNKPAKIIIYSEKNREITKTIPNFDWSFKNQAINFIKNLRGTSKSISSGSDSLKDIKAINDIWKKKFN